MKIIDLTLTYRSGMRGVDIQTAKTLEKDGWNATTITLYSHAGTHMDAPLHFDVSNRTIDEMPLNNCIGKAWILDIPDCEDHRLITSDDLGILREKFTSGDSLLVRTGWSHYVELPRYRNAIPGISRDLAEWCVVNKVKMLGVEPPSVADVNDLEELTCIHWILLSGGVTIVEGLTNLDRLNTAQVTLFAIPLKIYRGDGAPARVFAMMD